MSKTNQQSKAATLAQMQAVISGLQKHAANGQFTFAGTAYTTATLVALFQSAIDAINVANAAQASAADAVSAMHAVVLKGGPVYLALKQNLQGTLGAANATLGDYGIAPRKPRKPLTVEQKAVAKAKAAATRKARGTTSKKQKLAISGDVTGVTITPVTAPQPAAAPAATATAPTTPGK